MFKYNFLSSNMVFGDVFFFVFLDQSFGKLVTHTAPFSSAAITQVNTHYL